MSWEIRIPHRDLAEPLDAKAIAQLPRALADPDERAIARELLVQFRLVGAKVVGEAVWGVESLDGSERRRLLNALRKRLGLESIKSIEDRWRYESASQAGRLRARATSPWVLCAEPACSQAPINELGVPVPSTVNRWWCPQHAHLAKPGDIEERQLPIRLSRSGALVEYDPAADEAEHAREESHRRQLEEEAAAREHTAAEAAEHKRQRDAAFRRELPPGVPG